MSVNRTRRLSVIAALCVASTVAACSSASSQGSSPAGSASGTILLGTESPFTGSTFTTPQIKSGIQAAIDGINASGGIDGRKLQLEACDTVDNANQELSCMRQLISDKVSAIVAPNIVADQSGREFQLADAAHMPVLGSLGLSPSEFTTPGVYPLSSGIPGWAYGMAEHLLALGKRKITLLGTADGAAQFVLAQSKAALAEAGVSPVATVTVDETTDPTFTVGATKAATSGADGIILVTHDTMIPKAVAGLRQAGYTGSIACFTGVITPPVVKTIAAAGNGMLLTSQVALASDASNPTMKHLVADMSKYQPGASIEELSIIGWGAVQLFATLAKQAGASDAASISKTLGALTSPINVGIAGPFDKPASPPFVKDFPDIYNPTIQNGTLENGQIVPDGKGFVNPFTTLASLKGK